MAVVQVINKFIAKDPLLSALLRKLVVVTLQHNIFVRACHVPGSNNVMADLLSRNQVTQARMLQPSLQPNPTVIPPELNLSRLLQL